MDIYMQILGFAILIIHRATLLIVFPNRFKLRYSIGILIIALFATNLFRNVTADLIPWSGLSTFLNLFLMCWLLKGSFFQITFAYYFQYILTVVQFYITEAIVGVFINPASQNFTLIIFIPVMVMYTASVILMVKYGRRIYQKLLVDGRTAEWVLYSLGAVFSFVVLTVSRDFPNSALLNILLLLLIVWSFIVFCYAIINTHEKSKQKYEADFARDIISSGQEHYEKMNEQYDALRTMKHDYQFHLNAAVDMLRRGEIEKSGEYLTEIQAELSEFELQKYCSNPVINSLVADYAERCKKLDIKYTIKISIPDSFSVPNYDMCIILGNLLENALAACLKISESRELQLVVKPQGEQLAIMLRNSFDGVVSVDGEQITSKKKDGGLGLRSVQAVSSRHGGELVLEHEGQWFKAFVLLRLK